MRIITCASYYGTGSSAITDLINECDNVKALGDYEFRFVQDPDGIRDLEYNLVSNNHRHNSGYALKRYEKNVKYLNGNVFIKKYNKFFGKNWKLLSKEYIDSLVDVEYKGYWHQDVRDKGMLVYFLERGLNKIMHELFHVDKDRNFTLFMGKNTNYAAYPEERFYELTRKYIDDLFATANKENKAFIMVDQLVPPSNTSEYIKFFNDIKVICVDRDPRDLYILEKKFWMGTIIPHNVDAYCKWFKATRKHREHEKDDTNRVLRIYFEDLIYHYEEMVPQILEFCGIDKKNHTAPRTRLIPEESIKNTKLFMKYKEYNKDIAIIENELADYLYMYN